MDTIQFETLIIGVMVTSKRSYTKCSFWDNG